MARICVDLDRCEGHGRCYAVAPDLIGPMDDHGHAEALAGDLDEGDTALMDLARRVVSVCPEEALSLEDAAS